VQGAGAAMLQSNSVAIVATAAPPHRLRSALGLQAAAQAVGLAAGPTIGGLIVQTLGWRAVFALNVPIGLAGLLAGRYLLPRTRLDPDADHGVRTVLGRADVRRGLAGALLAYLVLFGPVVLVPNLLQAAGVAPLAAGLVVAALPVGFAVGAVAAQHVLPRDWPPSRQSWLGVAAVALGLAGLLLGSPAERGVWAVGLACCGLGLGLFTPANNATVMTAAPASSAAVAGGLVSASRALGTAGATALVAATISLASDGRVTVLTLGAGTLVMAATLSRGRRGRDRSARSRARPASPAGSAPGS
jgi:MFS family permease